MVEITTEILAYAMEIAYRDSKTQHEAVEKVRAKYQRLETTDVNILNAMWAAIDAYVDINT